MEETEKKAGPRGLSGAVLKWTAIVTMFIDHATAMAYITWLVPLRRAAGISPILSAWEYQLYDILRAMGRPAFPIFCFLLVEGFFHTRDIRHYLGRLLVFGLISELPFDHALFGHLTWQYQNVYFTLFLGLLAVWSLSLIMEEGWRERPWTGQLLRVLCCAAVSAAAMGAAEILKTDYGWTGVALILLLYLFRRRVWLRDLSAGLVLLTAGWIEMVGWIAFPLLHLYKDRRGPQPKYFFYAFYPAHLALLWLLRFLCIGT